MSRITERFARAKAEGRGAFVAYLTAGYPSIAATVEMAVALDDAGVDVLELGVPFSDPVADGPVIQRASEAALARGATLEKCLGAAAEIAGRVRTPIVLFSYFNPLLQHGLDRLAGRLSDVGVDGLLVIDVIPEEAAPLLDAMRPSGVDTVFLVAPTSSDGRIERIASVARGFVYAVSRTGVTGAREALSDRVGPLVERVRRHTDLPVAVGFGISSAEQVAEVWRVADGAVVGSHLVSEIARDPDAPDVVARVAACAAALIPR
jgi:tryptophan synthase alpha chain